MSVIDTPQKRRDRQMTLTVIVMFVVALILLAGGAFLFTKLFTGHILTIDDYDIYVLESGEYTTTVEAQGTVEPYKTAVTVPTVEGTVSSIEVADGDKVEEGQLLVTIENDDITYALSSAKDDYEYAQNAEASAQSSYDAAQSELNQAEADKEAALETAQALADAEAAAKALEEDTDGTEDEGDAAETETETETEEVTVDSSYDTAISMAQINVTSALSALYAAQDDTASAKSAYAQAQEEADKLEIRAETDGTIMDTIIQEGDSIADYQNAISIMNIADVDTLVVRCSVPEDEVALLDTTLQGTVSGIDDADEDLFVTVAEISDMSNGTTSEDGSDCHDVILALSSQKAAEDGMSVSAVIDIEDYDVAYVVPSGAVLQDDEASYVEAIYDDATIATHEVRVIDVLDDGQLVVSGSALADGLKIRADFA